MRQGPFRAILPLVLASASPRRQAILATQGLCFEVIPSSVKEPLAASGESPEDYAARMACLKGQDIAGRHPDKIVISADTIVVQGGTILGKPRNVAHALDMLASLSGGWHEVMTGFCVLHAHRQVSHCRTVTTRVHMAANTPDMLAAYVATGEPMDKAGAYGLQGAGGVFVRRVEGDPSAVIGLPLSLLREMILQAGKTLPKEKL